MMVKAALAAAVVALCSVAGTAVAKADNVQNMGTLGDYLTQLEGWGYTPELQSGFDIRYLQPEEESLCLIRQASPTVSGPVDPPGTFYKVYIDVQCPTYGGSNTDSGAGAGDGASSSSSGS